MIAHGKSSWAKVSLGQCCRSTAWSLISSVVLQASTARRRCSMVALTLRARCKHEFHEPGVKVLNKISQKKTERHEKAKGHSLMALWISSATKLSSSTFKAWRPRNRNAAARWSTQWRPSEATHSATTTGHAPARHTVIFHVIFNFFNDFQVLRLQRDRAAAPVPSPATSRLHAARATFKVHGYMSFMFLPFPVEFNELFHIVQPCFSLFHSASYASLLLRGFALWEVCVGCIACIACMLRSFLILHHSDCSSFFPATMPSMSMWTSFGSFLGGKLVEVVWK